MPFYGLAGQLIFLPGRAGPFFLPTPAKSGYCHAGARQKNSRPPEIVFMGCMDVFHKMYKCMPPIYNNGNTEENKRNAV